MEFSLLRVSRHHRRGRVAGVDKAAGAPAVRLSGAAQQLSSPRYATVIFVNMAL